VERLDTRKGIRVTWGGSDFVVSHRGECNAPSNEE
jgi:hypothetical protein